MKLHICKPQILVAEDNRVMGNVMRFNLLRAGIDVTMVHDGRAALRQLEHQRFDMVVTDYQMPHASGQDVCRYVRDESMCPEIPVVLVSAKGIELRQSLTEEGESVDDRGFTAIVYKPFSPQEIVRTVRQLLEPFRCSQDC